jgi:cellulose synthase/poly-beta-1,6-N-acetylglucosamine synthase-like glycosyltransferase
MLVLPILSGAISALALLLLPAAGVLFAEIISAVTGRPRTLDTSGPRPRIAVLIPAHNEAARLAVTLASVSTQLRATDRVLVVADNCSDETAAVAASAGAEVIQRTDETHRGKGYALDFGIRHLESDPPEVVIVIDADCQISAGSCDRLAMTCAQSGRPVQALYLMRAGLRPGLKMRVAEFAWTVKNQARAEGLHRLGLPCQLTGSGMAFPWSGIASAELATAHIVEDLKLGLDLARAGTAPVFCPEALVTSSFPNSADGIKTQRTRWEHGHLNLILTQTPRVLRAALRPRNFGLIAMALDLSVPPLALLTMIVAVVWSVSLGFYLRTGFYLPLLLATADSLLIGVAVLLAWRRYGRDIISLSHLALSGVYALWKIPLYARVLVARQVAWVRSARDDD